MEPDFISQFVLPLLYLLLERHFEIIRVCQTRTVHKNELWDASNTLDFLFDAVETRVEILQCWFCFPLLQRNMMCLHQQLSNSKSSTRSSNSNRSQMVWYVPSVRSPKFVSHTLSSMNTGTTSNGIGMTRGFRNGEGISEHQ